MNTIPIDSIQREFELLPSEERVAIIQEGAALRLSALKKRQFLAESKIRHFQEKHQTTLTALDADGLPDDADYELHEDYCCVNHHLMDVETRHVASLHKTCPSKHG